MIAKTPPPPYYAVVFTSILFDEEGYESMADKMEELAKGQPGYLGIELARNAIGITFSYWNNLESIRNWKQNTEHLFAQKKGRELWYKQYTIRICMVEKEYGFER